MALAEARRLCAAWAHQYELEEDALVEARAEAERWAGLALVARLSPPALSQLLACGVSTELISEEATVYEMVFARSACRHISAMRLKPPEFEQRALSAAVPSLATLTPVESVAASVLVVVARYREDVSWLQQLPTGVTFHVMQKSALQPELPTTAQTLLPNVGREAHSYLTFALAAREDETLAPLLVFTQGDPFAHNPAFLEEVAALHARVASEGTAGLTFTPLALWSGGERTVHCDPSGAPHQSRLVPVAKVWRQLFGASRPLPLWLPFTPGAMFAVPQEALRRQPRELHERGLHSCGLSASADPIEGHAFERLWRFIFAE